MGWGGGISIWGILSTSSQASSQIQTGTRHRNGETAGNGHLENFLKEETGKSQTEKGDKSWYWEAGCARPCMSSTSFILHSARSAGSPFSSRGSKGPDWQHDMPGVRGHTAGGRVRFSAGSLGLRGEDPAERPLTRRIRGNSRPRPAAHSSREAVGGAETSTRSQGHAANKGARK